ncbi:cupin 4 family protein [Chrysochromulina tobinii]|uniref:Bifunctional lysine-specific demethylase and histidyl-hydroxylase n=1 Tax=Chrysochromulina tobinii TaxID=1460289 RepID=A0A0M0K4F8_9EUKA|nr:cupin 4 family protein [Chrysochromulina tobinii]|eukprot:KOO33694.1 cupin 4 family protein [Chrysochromulina sp. CCMP291]
MIQEWHGLQGRSAEFLSQHWQKRPLLIRGLLAPDELPRYCPLSPGGLRALACQPGALTRLIRESGGAAPWECRRGPFGTADFESLGLGTVDPNWTLLVQRVDRVLEEVERLRELFAFVPRWRVDDVMVSHAPPGGSVGAHVDNYDVILLQGSGTREWRVESVPRPSSDEELLPALQTRVLRRFEPSHQWELRAGDALYLPPRFAHHGVSTSVDCLTYSVGFRAPSRADLLTSFARHAARLSRLRAMVRESLLSALDDEAGFEAWVGEALTGTVAASAASAATATSTSSAASVVSSALGASSLETAPEKAGGPAELGPAARQAMEAWIAAQGAKGWGNEGGEGEDEQVDDEEQPLRLRLEADLNANLEADLEANLNLEADLEATIRSSVDEDDDPLASSRALVAALARGDAAAPRMLRHAEDAIFGCVERADGGLSLFVNGERLGGIGGKNECGSSAEGEAAAVAARGMHALCASSFVNIDEPLRAALRVSAEMRALVELLLERDALWAALDD